MFLLLLWKTGFSEVLNFLFLQTSPDYRILKSKFIAAFLRNLEDVIPWYSDLCYFVKVCCQSKLCFLLPHCGKQISLCLCFLQFLLQFVGIWISFYLSSSLFIVSFQSEEITFSFSSYKMYSYFSILHFFHPHSLLQL